MIGALLGRFARMDDDQARREDVRVAYWVMSQRSEHESQLRGKYLAMLFQVGVLLLVASSYPAFIGSTEDKIIRPLGIALAVLGVVVTAIFASIIHRLGEYNAYWMASARELERQMAPGINPIVRGREFADGHCVEVDDHHMQLKPLGLRPAMRHLRLVYWAFGVLFLIVAVYNALILTGVLDVGTG